MPLAAIPESAERPLVRVPVLSKSTASMLRIRSRARRSFTRMPARAATEVEMLMTRGIASPSAWGQAITRTVTVRTKAALRSPSAHQAMNVTAPDAVAT